VSSAYDLLWKLRGCLFGCLALLAFSFSGTSLSVDNYVSALRMQAATRPPSNTITIVTIDAESIAQAGEWPWPRERFATVLDNLNMAGAGLIALDVDFSARSNASGDAALLQAVEDNAGWIVLPAFLQQDFRQTNTPFAELADVAEVASVNVELSRDGRLRTYRRGYFYKDTYYPSLGGVLAGVAVGDTRSFTLDYSIASDQIDTISFDDVLNNRFDASLVAGRSILIGATALELGDLVSTPHSPATPGVFAHAQGYESLIQNRALTSPPASLMILLGMAVLLAGNAAARFLKLRTLFVLQLLLTSLTLVVPFVVQVFLPLSIPSSGLLFAIAWASGAGIWNAFARHRRALIEQEASYLTYMAEHDSETRMPNRRAFLSTLDAVQSRNPFSTLMVITFGIKRFGELRGAVGYANANSLIQTLAERLYETGLGPAHFHLGASVLGTFLEMESGSRREDSLAKVRAALSQTIVIAGQPLHIDLRAGISFLDPDTKDGDEALKRASLSLDHSRQTRQDIVQWGDTEFEDPQLRLALLTEVTAGLDRGEFHLVYQPKFCTRTGVVLGVEALMRWNHPAFGFISPDRFITVAEDTGTIDTLTLWAIEQAIRDQANLHRMGHGMPIAVNMSARSLLDTNLCRQVADMITRADAEIAIEITETAVMEHPELAIRSSHIFRDAGIKLSIDDYGAGQSSIAYLKRFPANELKLDRSMIEDVLDSERDQMILRSTFDLAHALGMRVVCEGIEDVETFDVLKELGCDVIQGYLVGRPMRLAELVEHSRARSHPPAPPAAAPRLARSGT
jgi:EAL domain-containing protein (putative c-di-GMP-specific phosphodiesterase class I)/CHASE2 domain-containing sensor protein